MTIDGATGTEVSVRAGPEELNGHSALLGCGLGSSLPFTLFFSLAADKMPISIH